MNDSGVATVWAAWATAALMAFGGALMVIGAVASARHRANSAADMAALAAAAYGPWGEEYACGQAGWVIEQMGMQLKECRMNGWVAQVEVTATISGLGRITARTKAGPMPDTRLNGRNRPPAAGSGRPRAVSGITGKSRRVGERYRRPADVRLERPPGFTRRSLPTSCRQAVTTSGIRAV
ncbi:secretion/DNA translocation related TadE-like protein [Kibdelosporangium banguiense]|uniref:Secretion/DNA translocation related TadE-like protein n=1 Tax=Kibdelosporangium banguiense TaxID=1365924 RepID=A0ABS4TAR2_9PSEU|nr:Rv3654c family TadE-like protein [Kibdelosporangium banguiense]MBP2321426.1 secretion/DNA translocation related TadE-like protein [Kibdelosporangium banguiense]